METERFSHHISRRFNEDLEHVRSEVLRMGGLVERHLELAVQAIADGDSAMGLQLAAEDHKINRMEVAIDEECTKIIATRGPTAADLRLITAATKIIRDLERIGDEARKIAILAVRLATGEQDGDEHKDMVLLAGHVQKMVRGALDAFSRMDARDALVVAEQDHHVDEQYDAVTRRCVAMMIKNPHTIHRFLDMTWVARALERIGDHATNIAEHVVYLVHGKDIRHVGIDRARQELGLD